MVGVWSGLKVFSVCRYRVVEIFLKNNKGRWCLLRKEDRQLPLQEIDSSAVSDVVGAEAGRIVGCCVRSLEGARQGRTRVGRSTTSLLWLCECEWPVLQFRKLARDGLNGA